MDTASKDIVDTLKIEAKRIQDALGLDSVVIVVTGTLEGNKTTRCHAASGNVYAVAKSLEITADIYYDYTDETNDGPVDPE